MMASSIPGWRAHLVAELSARLAPVPVTYAADGADLQREAVWLGSVSFTAEPDGFRADRLGRRETYQQRLVIYTGWEGRDAREADERAYELFAEVENLVAGGTLDTDQVESVEITAGTSKPEGSDVGFIGYLEVTLTVTAQVD